MRNVSDNMQHLIIGCGGAGLATMVAHCRKLAFSRCGRDCCNYHYFAIDTDEQALRSFEESMRILSRGSFHAYVRTFLISRNVFCIDEIVHPHFVAPFVNDADAVGLKRLKEHWWFDDNGQPYGFGQYGVVRLHGFSGERYWRAVDCYGLVWNKMSEIDDVIRDLLESVAHNSSYVHGFEGLLDVHVISSLAGETGRGTWSLVAMKVREYLLRRFKIAVRPVGVLFDASIYQDIFLEGGHEFALRLKVNSLTGLSELSAWMDNEKRKGPISYRLPDQKMPERELCDVLVVDGNDRESLLSEGPIGTQPQLKWRNANHPRSPAETFENAGRELFLKMESPSLAARRGNYFSSSGVDTCESATFDVDVEKISDFCRNCAREIVLRRMMENSDDVSSDVVRFFDSIPVNVCVSGLADVRPNQTGSLLQRIAFELAKCAGPDFEHLRQALPTLGMVQAKHAICQTVRERSPHEVQKSVEAVLLSLGLDGGGDSVRGVVRKHAMRVFRGSHGSERSIGRLKDFLLQVKAVVDIASDLPATIELPLSAECAAEKFGKRTVLETLLLRPRFNDLEVFELLHRDGEIFSGIVVDQFLVENYVEIRRVVSDVLGRVSGEINCLLAVVAKIEEGCIKVCAKLAEDGLGDFGVPRGDNPFESLFATPDRSLEAIVENGANRILKPIVESQKALRNLISDAIPLDGHFGTLMDGIVERAIEKAAQSCGSETVEDVSHLIQCAIKDGDLLKDNFIADNFSFMAVLERNRTYWNEEAKRHTGNSDTLDKLSDFFYRMLGTGFVWNGHELRSPVLPPVKVLKYSIIATFHYYARPDVRASEEAQVREEMTVFVPFKEDGEWKINKQEIGGRIGSLSCELIDVDDPASSIFSYTALVDVTIAPPVHHSRPIDIPDGSVPQKNVESGRRHGKVKRARLHPFDMISALNYYCDGDVMAKLIEAERKDGKSIFDSDPILGGLGYVSPIYVRNRAMSEARWKPWMSAEDEVENLDQETDKESKE